MMKIVLFGVPCVGTSTLGEKLAGKIGYSFYDLVDEIKK